MQKDHGQECSLEPFPWERATTSCIEVREILAEVANTCSDGFPAYEGGPDSIQLPWLCFFALITGVGGAAAFAGAIKTCKAMPFFVVSLLTIC